MRAQDRKGGGGGAIRPLSEKTYRQSKSLDIAHILHSHDSYVRFVMKESKKKKKHCMRLEMFTVVQTERGFRWQMRGHSSIACRATIKDQAQSLKRPQRSAAHGLEPIPCR